MIRKKPEKKNDPQATRKMVDKSTFVQKRKVQAYIIRGSLQRSIRTFPDIATDARKDLHCGRHCGGQLTRQELFSLPLCTSSSVKWQSYS